MRDRANIQSIQYDAHHIIEAAIEARQCELPLLQGSELVPSDVVWWVEHFDANDDTWHRVTPGDLRLIMDASDE